MSCDILADGFPPNSPFPKPSEGVKHFHLEREIDESGMSGLGKVAEGVILPNGMAVMWWLVPPHSIQQYRSIDDLSFIHWHGAKNTTKIIYDEN